MLPQRPSSPEPGQVAKFRRALSASGAGGGERRRSASPPHRSRPPSPPRIARPPSPPPRWPPPGVAGLPRRPDRPDCDRERWDSPGRYDRPVVYDRYSRDSRDSEWRARRASSPASGSRGSRGPSPTKEREIPREPVFKGLDGLTQYLSRTIMARAKVEQASRALRRIKEFQPDAATLADAEGALSAAEAALRAECDALADAFAALLQQALAVPGVAAGDVTGLHVDELRARVARLEAREPSGPGLTEDEIKAFVKASAPAAAPASEEDIRALVRKEALSEERVREIARASASGLNEAQVRALVAKSAPTEDRIREIVLASAPGLNEEQVRAVVRKNAPQGLSDEHIRALIRLNAPTLEQIQDIVRASLPAAVSAAAPAASAGAASSAPAPPPPEAQAQAPAQAITKTEDTKPEPEADAGDVKGAGRPQIRLRALLAEVLQRVEAVESAMDERYERLQADVDEQRYDLSHAVGRYELAAARRAALPPGDASLEGTPAPGAAKPDAAPVAPGGELASMKAELDALRSQLAAVGGELDALRAEVASLRSQPAQPTTQPQPQPQPQPQAPQKLALGPEFDAKMAAWKAAILKDIEDWIHAKMPGIVAPILEDMKGKVLAQMLAEARAGGLGAAGVGAGAQVPRVNSPSGRFAPQQQGYQYGYMPYQPR